MYLDPGFGGMLLQVLVVIVAMGGAILFSLRRKIRSLFSRGNNRSENAANGDITEANSFYANSDTSISTQDDEAIDMLDNEPK